MSLRKIHLLSNKAKSLIDNYILQQITQHNKDLVEEIKDLKDKIKDLKYKVKEKDLVIDDMQTKFNLLEQANKKALSDITILAQAINNIFYVIPTYTNYLKTAKIDDDDEDIYH